VEITPVPNGDDKNWIRLCGAIDGFRVKYGKWPTKILLPEGILNDLKQHVFTKERFAKIEEKLAFVIEGLPIVAADDKGNSYSYGDLGFPKKRPEIIAQEWLAVYPVGTQKLG
jgi:hypothetical protein